SYGVLPCTLRRRGRRHADGQCRESGCCPVHQLLVNGCLFEAKPRSTEWPPLSTSPPHSPVNGIIVGALLQCEHCCRRPLAVCFRHPAAGDAAEPRRTKRRPAIVRPRPGADELGAHILRPGPPHIAPP